jgi:hypothetical protein
MPSIVEGTLVTITGAVSLFQGRPQVKFCTSDQLLVVEECTRTKPVGNGVEICEGESLSMCLYPLCLRFPSRCASSMALLVL